MLRLVLVCAVLLLVAGGGAAGWWFGLRGEPFPFASAEAAEAEPNGGPAAGAVVELEPLTFPVMRGGQVRELVTYVVRLEVATPQSEANVKARTPAVRDAMLSELHGLYAYRFLEARSDKLALVKRRLLKAARRAADAEIEAVLLRGLATRPQQAERP
jgi:hypothetical protein